MLPFDIQQEFDVATAHVRHRQLSADLPVGLGVVRYDVRWTNAWDYFIGQSPKSFYETLCRNIDGVAQVYINFMETEEDNFSVNIKRNGRFVFKAENRIIHDGRGKTLRFKEWVNEDPDSRGKGMGLNLFKNIFEVAERGGIDLIELRAGKEDGKYFWARHGFYLKSDFYRHQMADQVRDNLQKYSDTLPTGIQSRVQNIIDHTGLDMCWHLARLDGCLEGKPLGWKLVEGYNPEYALDLKNPEQVAHVKASFVRPAPVASPAPVPAFA